MKYLIPDRLTQMPRDDKAIEVAILEQKPQYLVTYILRFIRSLMAMYIDIAKGFKRVQDDIDDIDTALDVLMDDDDHTFFEPRRITQAAEPTLTNDGEMAIWHDSDLTGVFLIYKDPDEGQVKVQLT